MTKTILVLHLAGQYPMAGIAFQALHYVMGLSRLGYDVYYIEDSTAQPYDPKKLSIAEDISYNIFFLRKFMKQFGLDDKWSYCNKFHNLYFGLKKEKVMQLYKETDAIINVCGATLLREEHLDCPIRIYMETDPLVKELKILGGDIKEKRNILAHTHHFTYGGNLINSRYYKFSKNIKWNISRPPIVLDLWRYRFNLGARKFTTITTWLNDKKGIILKGKKYYWSKHHNFLKYLSIPLLTKQKFEITLDEEFNKKEGEILRKKGWSLEDPYKRSSDLNIYQDYIYSSRGEFTVAKDLVVRTNSGWFSDRSVCYLAAGKPVVTQETGFSKFIPTGKGLFSFNNVQEAADAINEINKNYEYHCKEARKIAEEYFDSDKVLGEMLKQCGI